MYEYSMLFCFRARPEDTERIMKMYDSVRKEHPELQVDEFIKMVVLAQIDVLEARNEIPK